MSKHRHPTVLFRPGHAARLRHGHPWAYSNELVIDAAAKALPPGGVVRLADAGGEALGRAFFNPHSLIAARWLDGDAEAAVDAAFLGQRLAAALALRERLFADPHYRLVHAEGDGLPGLIVDRFGDVLVCQPNGAGIDRLMPEVIDALDALLAPRAVVIRADAPVRRLEGLAQSVGVARGAIDGPIAVIEDGARFLADPIAGQKTGWYFDQRDNRAFLARLAKGARVLDAYAYSAGFALRLALAGAVEAVAVDRSDAALDLGARAAAGLGIAERCRFVRAEAFADLARRADAGERFDIVIADPPSFAKSRREIKPALRGYRKLARLAAAVVAAKGFLFIASCSHNVSLADFTEAARRGIGDAGRRGRTLRVAGAGPDHPRHLALPETDYLKALVLQLD